MNKRLLWMMAACILPLLLIFFAPAIGIEGNVALFTFIVVLFAIHLLLPMKHKGHTHGLTEDNYEKKISAKDKQEKEATRETKIRPH